MTVILPILLGLTILFTLVQVSESIGNTAKRSMLGERVLGLVGLCLLLLIFLRLPWPFGGDSIAAQFWNIVLWLVLSTFAFIGAWIARLLRVRHENEPHEPATQLRSASDATAAGSDDG